MVAATRRSTQAHRRALDTSSGLTGVYFQMYRRGQSMIPPLEVIRLLRTGKVSFVLIGTHGVGGWRSQARATQDVDILVTKRDHAKAVRILRKAFPKLIVEDSVVVTRFKDPNTNEPAIDLISRKKGFSEWFSDTRSGLAGRTAFPTGRWPSSRNSLRWCRRAASPKRSSSMVVTFTTLPKRTWTP